MNHSKTSAHDGKYLPFDFTQQYSSKPLVAYLNGVVGFAPDYWWRMTHDDRRIVLKHLQALDEVSSLVDIRIGGTRFVAPWPPKTVIATGEGRHTDFTHPPPNGGKRILMYGYTKLKDKWVHSNGDVVRPHDMDANHVKNTLNLLKESHSNLIGHAASRLDSMARHFQNCPKVMERLIALHEAIESTDVEEVYPVWTAIADTIERRQTMTITVNVAREVDIEDLKRRIREIEAHQRRANTGV